MNNTDTIIEKYHAAVAHMIRVETGKGPTTKKEREDALAEVEHLKRVLKAVHP